MHRRTHRHALTLVECVGVLTSLTTLAIVGGLGRVAQSPRDRMHQCASRLNTVHKGMVLFAQDFDGSFPKPAKISAETAAANPQSGNSSANVFSYMIFNTYYAPVTVICPDEPSPNVAEKKDYRYGTPDDKNWNDEWKWDPAFSADFTQPGANVSYAMLALVGERVEKEWADSLNRNFAVFADRGPRDGAFDAESLTLKRHGQVTDWTGNVMFNDLHLEAYTWQADHPKAFTVRDDNIFRSDDAEKGADIWLGVFGPTTEKTTTAYWD